MNAEVTNLEDAFNFELNASGKNGAEFEGGWTPVKYDALVKWVDAHPEKLKMTRQQFDDEIAAARFRASKSPDAMHHMRSPLALVLFS